MRATDSTKGPQPLNCIVDDSALLAGLKDRGSDSLKQWIQIGAINLYVPLYTLERLNLLRRESPPTNTEARRALEWLDHITNMTQNRIAGRVELQGPEDQYVSWQDVETYLLPDTPLSSYNEPDNLDGINEAFERNLRLFNTGTSWEKNSEYIEAHTTPSPDQSRSAGLIRPLLNYVVWRTYNQDPSIAGTGRYILLTNEPATQKQAQKFGVRAKLLSQVRSIVARDEMRGVVTRDYVEPQESEASDTVVEHRSVTPVEDDEEDEILFKPVQRPTSSRGNGQATKLWDPDHFGRTPVPVSSPPTASLAMATQKPSAPSSPRHVNSVPVRPDGNTNGSATRVGARGQSFRGHGIGSGRGSPRALNVKPIDPNSYVRPPPTMRRGRGGFRKLWEPTT